MSTYHSGLQSMYERTRYDVRPAIRQAVGRVTRPLGVGQDLTHGIITTPGTQAARISELGAAIDAFMIDVTKHRVRADQEAAWSEWRAQVATWVQQWRTFVEGAGWVNRLFVETDYQIDRYAIRLCQLIKEYQTTWGGKLTLPPPVICVDPTEAPAGSFWRTVAIGVAASLTAAGVLYLLRRAVSPPSPQGVVLLQGSPDAQ